MGVRSVHRQTHDLQSGMQLGEGKVGVRGMRGSKQGGGCAMLCGRHVHC
jgi:hypothetical protein